MKDELEEFVLEGEARKVDAWWHEHGMGMGVIRWAFSYQSPADGEWNTCCEQEGDDYSSLQPCFSLGDHWEDKEEWWYDYDVVPFYTSDSTHTDVFLDMMYQCGHGCDIHMVDPCTAGVQWHVAFWGCGKLAESRGELLSRTIMLAAARALGLSVPSNHTPEALEQPSDTSEQRTPD